MKNEIRKEESEENEIRKEKSKENEINKKRIIFVVLLPDIRDKETNYSRE